MGSSSLKMSKSLPHVTGSCETTNTTDQRSGLIMITKLQALQGSCYYLLIVVTFSAN